MLLFLLTFVFATLHRSAAYTIHQSCLDPTWQALGINIQASVDEALSMAEYGQWRMQTNQPAVGPVLQQLLGNNGNARSMFINRMGTLPAAFGPYTGVFNPHVLSDRTVVIKCTPSTMFPVPPTGPTVGWKDRDFPLMPQLAVVAEPCRAGVIAYTYRTGYSRTPNAQGDPLGPSHAIMLCSLYADQAMARRNTIGTDWSQRRWDGLSFNVIGQYLSPTLLHEGLHVAGLPGVLPSGGPELYEWSYITASNRNDDKQANADSYSTLASVLWMKRNTIGTRGTWGRRHRVNNRPGDSPHDGHP